MRDGCTTDDQGRAGRRGDGGARRSAAGRAGRRRRGTDERAGVGSLSGGHAGSGAGAAGVRDGPRTAGLRPARRDDDRDHDLPAGEHQARRPAGCAAPESRRPRWLGPLSAGRHERAGDAVDSPGRLRPDRHGPARRRSLGAGELRLHGRAELPGQRPAIRRGRGGGHRAGQVRAEDRRPVRGQRPGRSDAAHDDGQHRARHGPDPGDARRGEAQLLRGRRTAARWAAPTPRCSPSGATG